MPKTVKESNKYIHQNTNQNKLTLTNIQIKNKEEREGGGVGWVQTKYKKNNRKG